MGTRKYLSMVVLVLVGLLSAACLLPGMIPMTGSEASEAAGPAPVMEKDADKLIEVLNGGEYVRLEYLAEERYTEQDFAGPGRLKFTIQLTEAKPVLFAYGWCTTTQEILQQNADHISVNLYLNGAELGSDVVHPLTFTRSDGLVCLDQGALLSEWPAGEYKLEAVASFDEKINDGLADYEAGEYAFEYNVTVPE